MDNKRIFEIVTSAIHDYCDMNNIELPEELGKDTALIGRTKLLDSMGLVNVIVDIETVFLDEDVDLSLTSEAAMSSRISPFRSIGSLCNFIARQIGVEEL